MSEYQIGKEVSDLQRALRLILVNMENSTKALQETRDCLEKLASGQGLVWSEQEKSWISNAVRQLKK